MSKVPSRPSRARSSSSPVPRRRRKPRNSETARTIRLGILGGVVPLVVIGGLMSLRSEVPQPEAAAATSPETTAAAPAVPPAVEIGGAFRESTPTGLGKSRFLPEGLDSAAN